ncbi:ATP-binding protein [Chamaesiphon polymorphus]|uniref:Uncharacterized AAA domain-containing protein ycf46 n=1 Tax=Chamaesiphon polymorphus CCALA 037 TaxID=2107692 RepID=A0A2T1GF09_9CYAN|nr:AAA family ATPase [Chamaesiphon polymorphus]PSB56151.1 AAA family ATPase [Chamaesiphon polymorphus CCALA 037]
MSLAAILTDRPSIAISIDPPDRQHTLERVAIAAAQIGRQCAVWTPCAQGWHDWARALSIWEDGDLERSIAACLQVDRLPLGVAVYVDLFAAIATLPPAFGIRATIAIENLCCQLQQSSQHRIVFLETGEIPTRFARTIYSYELPLPIRSEIESMLKERELPIAPNILNALSGLTESEVKIALQRVDLHLDPSAIVETLLNYKYAVFKNHGLEFLNETTTKDIGGLDLLKAELDLVLRTFSDEARAYNIPLHRGFFTVGPPGVGKTYFAKICSQKLGFPLVNIGIDAVKSQGIVKFKQMLRRIDACEPCIAFIDELDKFFPRGEGERGDEASEQILAVLLTWLNEKTSRTLSIATANRLRNIPVELTRAGRFDSAYYIDFPSPAERKEILQIHCARFDRAFECGDGRLSREEWARILEKTNKCTGAELAQIATDAARAIFCTLAPGAELKIELTDLLTARENMKTLNQRDGEAISAMENQAKGFCKPASSNTSSPFDLPIRKLYKSANN